MTAATPYKWLAAGSLGAASAMFATGSDRTITHLWALAALATWFMALVLDNADKRG